MTLLEVLISIGVVAIGLLGVASLIPAGGQQAQAGARNDRKAQIGRRSIREFFVRGLDHVDGQWAVWSTAMSSYAEPDNDGDNDGMADSSPLTWPFNTYDQNGDLAFTVDDLIAFPRSVCMDPRGLYLAQAGARAVGGNEPQALSNASIFGYDPLAPSNAVTWLMPRVVPIRMLSSIALNEIGPAYENAFLAQDDIQFVEPETNGDTPVQKMVESQFSDGSIAFGRRDAEGRYSWLAMLVPLDPVRLTSGVTYRLYTVIVAARNSFQNVNVIPVAANGAGNVDIVPFDEGVRVRLPLAVDNIRPGDWVMLAARSTLVTATDPHVGEGNFGWYQVRNASDDILDLAGLALQSPPPSQNPWVYAVVMPNVKAVYSKTIRLKP